MNDETIEQQLRELTAPELPKSWRAEILSTAVRAASAPAASRQVGRAILIYLRHLFARNPITAGVLTALWLLIFLFKAGTPVDPSEKELLAHIDPNRPVYFVSLRDEILLAQLLENQSDERQTPQIP
jgi:hypothetical protein